MIRLLPHKTSARETHEAHVSTFRSTLFNWSVNLASHPKAGWLLFAYALAATVVETVPVTFILTAYVAAGRKPRWRLVVLSSAGSALGALLLASAFHLWGFELLSRYYPDLVATPAWAFIESWIAKYGMFAVAGIAAVPLPLTPALALCGLMRMPLITLFVSVLIGKFLKYSLTTGVALQISKTLHQYTGSGSKVIQ